MCDFKNEQPNWLIERIRASKDHHTASEKSIIKKLASYSRHAKVIFNHLFYIYIHILKILHPLQNVAA